MKRVEVNYVSGSATVVQDEAVADLDAITALVRECAYHCSGESLPKHVCQAEANQ